MAKTFRRAAVLGAGVMGSGIAAHLANAGIPSLLLDIVPPGGLGDDDRKAGLTESDKRFRNKFSQGGKDKALKSSPALLYTQADANLIDVGNFDDDLHRIKDCDWVVEVVKEDLGVKRTLFQKVAELAHKDAVISSNTSGLRIRDMMEGFPAEFRERFLVTHFFNPVRYMQLLELIPGPDTNPAIVEQFQTFGAQTLGKGIVFGKDTPNFVANRIGVYGIMETIRVMMEDGYSVDEVDAVFGPPMGRPKSAVFRTADVVGLDTFVHVATNCYDSLPDDEMRDVFKIPDFLTEMVKRGWLGNKTKQGFYKKEGGEILTLDWRTLEYKPKEKVRADCLKAAKDVDDVGERVRIITSGDDRLAQMAWKVTGRVLAYSARRIGEICDDVVNIDRAMRWGFAWDQGPFQAWDAIGVGDSAARMERDGVALPERVRDMLKSGRERFYESHGGKRTYFDFTKHAAAPIADGPRELHLASLKEAGRVVKENTGCSIVDLGDGIINVEFHTKMNALDGDIVEMLNAAVDMAEDGKYEGIVITNDGQNFSVGANLMMVFMLAQNQDWEQLNRGIREFQNANRRLRYCKVPVVAAPFQMTLGGGCEVCLWAPSVRAHAELYMGLVEVGVGLIPGAGGTVEMVFRALENAPDDPNFPTEGLLRKALENIAMAKVSMSGEEAKGLRYLRASDGITLNRDHLLYSAKEQALGMARAGYRPPRQRQVRLPGPSAKATFAMALRSMRDGHMISDHDLLIAEKLAHVMTGGDTSPRVHTTEQRLLDLEREAFLSLVGEAKTQERISYMLMNNKPLRN